MAHKTAYQCLVCGKALSHSDSMVLSAPGTPKVLVHRGRCFSKYKGKVRYGTPVGHGATRPSPSSTAPLGATTLPPRIAPIGAAPAPIGPTPPVESSKDEAPSSVLDASVPEVSSASEGDTSTASTSPIPEHTTPSSIPVYTNTFSARVLEYRKTHNMSQLDLAKRVGYKNASTVCAIEKGNISRPTERVYDIGTLLGLLRHEVDTLLTKRERVTSSTVPSDTAPSDSAPTVRDSVLPPSTIHHYNGISKPSNDTDLDTNSARCNELPYQVAAKACKALVLHILRQDEPPDMVLLGKLVEIGWGPLGREPQTEPSIGGGTGGTNAY